MTTRRDFLRSSALLAAAILADPELTVAAPAPAPGPAVLPPLTRRPGWVRLEDQLNRALKPLGYHLELRKICDRNALRGTVRRIGTRLESSFTAGLVRPSGLPPQPELLLRQLRYQTWKAIERIEGPPA